MKENNHSYTAIQVEGDAVQHYRVRHANGEQNDDLSNLSRINIFIGPNNAGKSRFMRWMVSNDKPAFTTSNFDLKEFESIKKLLMEDLRSLQVKYQINNWSTIQEVIKLPERRYLNQEELSKIHVFLHSEYSDDITRTIMNIGAGSINQSNLVNDFRTIIGDNKSKIGKIPTITPKSKYYIPVLRGLRPFEGIERDIFQARTQRDYFGGSTPENAQIYTGLSFYEDLKAQLLGPHQKRQGVRKFEEFLGQTFFNGKEVTLTPLQDSDVVHIKIGEEEKDYPIYDVGDGIQQIIILTYPLFFNQGENLCIFMEEPDLFLHPGYQRIFMETLMREEFGSFQFFFTTHSNHFLDMTLDFEQVSVFAFQKRGETEFLIQNVSSQEHRVLEMLGVRNSSVFLANCTLWVEGITERMYLRKYMQLYLASLEDGDARKGFKEDIHYAFIEYQGGNITHWSFLGEQDSNGIATINVEFISPKVFVLFDSDDVTKAGKKAERLEKLVGALGEEQVHRLVVREIENLLSKDILEKIIRHLEGDRPELDFSNFDPEGYSKESLGRLIEDQVKGLQRKYQASSGTIKDKVKFAQTAIAQMERFDDLTEEAQELTKKIFAFIQGNNP